MKSNCFKRIFTLILMTVVLFSVMGQAGIGVVAQEALSEEESVLERMKVDFEGCAKTAAYKSDCGIQNISFISSDSRIIITDGLDGSNAAKINRCDFRWWSLGYNASEYFIKLKIKIDDGFNNEFKWMINSQDPLTSTEGEGGLAITVKSRDDKKIAVYNRDGQELTVLEKGKIYEMMIGIKRGSDTYSFYLNGQEVRGDNYFSGKIYTISGLRMTVSGATEESYLLLDSIIAETKQKEYPQQYSSQSTGKIPAVEIPEAQKGSEEYRLFVNDKEITLPNPMVEKNGTFYLPGQHVFKCLGLELEWDRKNGAVKLESDKLNISAEVGSKKIVVNKISATLNAPIEKDDTVLMVPLNFINEALNGKVFNDAEAKMIVITTGKWKNDDVLRIINNKFYMNGEPYYEISFNKYDLFYQMVAEAIGHASYPSEEYRDQAAEEALAQLQQAGFSSIRVFVHTQGLEDRMYNEQSMNTFFETVDRMFDLCDKYDIKVVVCMGLISDVFTGKIYDANYGWISDGETFIDLVSDPQSQARSNCYSFIEKFVSRYAGRKTVLMWEIVNEGNLEADIGPQIKAVRFSLSQLAEFYSSCTEVIKRHDPDKLVTGGDAILRPAQWNLFEGTMAGLTACDWTVDTAEERLKALKMLNEAFDVMSVHAYGIGYSGSDGVYMSETGELVQFSFPHLMEEAQRLGKVLYNGETSGGTTDSYESFVARSLDYLQEIIASGVQLTHWWTFRSDRVGFDDGEAWRVESGELYEGIIAANKQIKDKYTVNSVAADNTDSVWKGSDEELFDRNAVTSGSEYIKQRSNGAMIGIFVGITVAVLALAGVGIYIFIREKNKTDEKAE